MTKKVYVENTYSLSEFAENIYAMVSYVLTETDNASRETWLSCYERSQHKLENIKPEIKERILKQSSALSRITFYEAALKKMAAMFTSIIDEDMADEQLERIQYFRDIANEAVKIERVMVTKEQADLHRNRPTVVNGTDIIQ